MKYALPAQANLNRVVMLVLGPEFDAAWKAGDSEKANPAKLSKVGIERTVNEILHDPETIIRVPELSINVEDGIPYVSYTDGRSRTVSLRKAGYTEIPVAVKEGMSLDALYKLPFIKPLPKKLRHELTGSADDLSQQLAVIDDLPEVIESKKRWAHSADGIKALREGFAMDGYGLIAEQLLKYFQQHGKMPPQEEIDRLMKQAMEKALDAGKTIEAKVVEKHGHLLQPAHLSIAQERAAAALQEIYASIRAQRGGINASRAEVEQELAIARASVGNDHETATDVEVEQPQRPADRILARGPDSRLQAERAEKPMSRLEILKARRGGPERGGAGGMGL